MALLRIEHLCKSYWVDGKEVVVLRDIQLAFNHHGLVFLLGPSGSGKSTLLHIIAGISEPTLGEIYDDDVLRTKPLFGRPYLDRTSLLFQSCLLLESHTPLSNIILPLLLQGMSYLKARKKAMHLIENFGLTALAKRDCRSLSGGEMQRIALLRMISHDKDIFLADEPTGALDDVNSHSIMTKLQHIAKQKLVIIVTHNQALANHYGERIIHLFDGRVIKDESKQEGTWTKQPKTKRSIKPVAWINIALAFHDLKHHFKRHLLGFCASFISMTALLVGLNFYLATNTFMASFTPLVNDYPFVQVSKKTAFQVEGSPLTLTKLARPSIHEMNGIMRYFPSSTYTVDLHSILNQSVSLTFQGEVYTDFYVSFYDDQDQDKSADIKVNSLLLSQMSESDSMDTITVSWDFVFDSIEDNSHTMVQLSEMYHVKVADNETDFMNRPCLYVPFRAMCAMLSNTMVHDDLSVIDHIASLPPNHYLSGYAYTIYLNDTRSYSTIYALEKAKYNQISFTFTNQQMVIHQAYQSLFSGLHMVLLIFLAIALFGTVTLVGILTYANIQARRKEMAIYTMIGMTKMGIWSIFCYENTGIQGISCLIACGLFKGMTPTIQALLKKGFGLPSTFIYGRQGTIEVLLLGGMVLLSTVLTFLVLMHIGQIELESELKQL